MSGTVPICPNCGTANSMKRKSQGAICLREGCGFKGKKGDFLNHPPDSRTYNHHWRDPIALTPGGHEDNG